MSFLLAIIYATFISLGLPDQVFGSGWPVMGPALGANSESAGIISMVATFGTIISAMTSSRLLRRCGTFKVSAVSIALTSVSLLGYAAAPNFLWVLALTIPLGMGGGAIDSAMNSFAALHFSSSHMNFLHACWGIGASAGPLIMGFFLNIGAWRGAYVALALIQLALLGLFLLSRRVWESAPSAVSVTDHAAETKSPTTGRHGRGLLTAALLGFFVYSAVEVGAGLWGASYLVRRFATDPSVAAAWIGAMFIALTLGRMGAGVGAKWISNRNLMRIGFTVAGCGAAAMLGGSELGAAIGLVLIGLGYAPIYPTMLKETSTRFGTLQTPRVMGRQIAAAYIGQTFIPPLIGVALVQISPLALPLTILAGIVITSGATEVINRQQKARTAR
ncbi:MFS transporter [Arcanobacterium canis]|uniref:MFS transporter n=1 Tax=Arcanobacterium canis TaxID=999183 RepID=A0ABY8FZZ6_9ACTO|nr:MFS transporter [Arcanobacterium canis]WFM83145.1 MFS transporter [Arcanobacterium canis]